MPIGRFWSDEGDSHRSLLQRLADGHDVLLVAVLLVEELLHVGRVDELEPDLRRDRAHLEHLARLRQPTARRPRQERRRLDVEREELGVLGHVRPLYGLRVAALVDGDDLGVEALLVQVLRDPDQALGDLEHGVLEHLALRPEPAHLDVGRGVDRDARGRVDLLLPLRVELVHPGEREHPLHRPVALVVATRGRAPAATRPPAASPVVAEVEADLLRHELVGERGVQVAEDHRHDDPILALRDEAVLLVVLDLQRGEPLDRRLPEVALQSDR
jgi:hypothetical protein